MMIQMTQFKVVLCSVQGCRKQKGGGGVLFCRCRNKQGLIFFPVSTSVLPLLFIEFGSFFFFLLLNIFDEVGWMAQWDVFLKLYCMHGLNQ